MLETGKCGEGEINYGFSESRVKSHTYVYTGGRIMMSYHRGG
ncbi:hypothetical protein HG15A2_03530 [Adhaeretor mobilis]|uniref:Uncharacterized protein n=1 Tax=Adhaeretor mobilis TaxID=1930276 RepID=A0A517MQD1_9BACT|nr:hypothetical protein HG15A2_03530 [Adhaeretor mobilis]